MCNIDYNLSRENDSVKTLLINVMSSNSVQIIRYARQESSHKSHKKVRHATEINGHKHDNNKHKNKMIDLNGFKKHTINLQNITKHKKLEDLNDMSDFTLDSNENTMSAIRSFHSFKNINTSNENVQFSKGKYDLIADCINLKQSNSHKPENHSIQTFKSKQLQLNKLSHTDAVKNIRLLSQSNLFKQYNLKVESTGDVQKSQSGGVSCENFKTKTAKTNRIKISNKICSHSNSCVSNNGTASKPNCLSRQSPQHRNKTNNSKRKQRQQNKRSDTLSAKLSALKEKSKQVDISQHQYPGVPLASALQELEKREKAAAETMLEMKNNCSVTSHDKGIGCDDEELEQNDILTKKTTNTGSIDPLLGSVIAQKCYTNISLVEYLNLSNSESKLVQYDIDKMVPKGGDKMHKLNKNKYSNESDMVLLGDSKPSSNGFFCDIYGRTKSNNNSEEGSRPRYTSNAERGHLSSLSAWNNQQVLCWVNDCTTSYFTQCTQISKYNLDHITQLIPTIEQAFVNVDGKHLRRFLYADIVELVKDEGLTSYMYDQLSYIRHFEDECRNKAKLDVTDIGNDGMGYINSLEISDLLEPQPSYLQSLSDPIPAFPSITTFSQEHIKRESIDETPLSSHKSSTNLTKDFSNYVVWENISYNNNNLIKQNQSNNCGYTQSSDYGIWHNPNEICDQYLSTIDNSSKNENINFKKTSCANLSPVSDSDSGIHSPVSCQNNYFSHSVANDANLFPLTLRGATTLPPCDVFIQKRSPNMASNSKMRIECSNVKPDLDNTSFNKKTSLPIETKWNVTPIAVTSSDKNNASDKYNTLNKNNNTKENLQISLSKLLPESKVHDQNNSKQSVMAIKLAVDDNCSYNTVSNKQKSIITTLFPPLMTSHQSSVKFAKTYDAIEACTSIPLSGTETSIEKSPVASNDYPIVNNKTSDKSKKHNNDFTFKFRRATAIPGKSLHLWEFIRDTLLNEEFCPKLIKWEDRKSGIFRFIQSDAIAQMWGKRKNNPKMTYEKLSRAMRYYYNRGILERVDGRRLVYKFGKNAHGWRLPECKTLEEEITETFQNIDEEKKKKYFSFAVDDNTADKKKLEDDWESDIKCGKRTCYEVENISFHASKSAGTQTLETNQEQDAAIFLNSPL